MTTKEPHFNGPEYKPDRDYERLLNQHERIKNLMLDGGWRTLWEISIITKDPPASISAQLRHLRKPRFGGFIIERRPRHGSDAGLYEYRMTRPKSRQIEFYLPKIKTCKHCGKEL